MVSKDLVEDTFAEAFDGLYVRLIVTGYDKEMLKMGAYGTTATPLGVMGGLDCGIERWLSAGEAPDRRTGAVLQFWKGLEKDKPLESVVKHFETELSDRIRGGILMRVFKATVFEALYGKAEGKMDMMKWARPFSVGFQQEKHVYGRHMIVVPLMVPDFLIERYIGYARGVSGGNFRVMCRTMDAVARAGKAALKAIGRVEGVITPFYSCLLDPRFGYRFPWIIPVSARSPILREKFGIDSKVPEDVKYIPETVINGVSMRAVKEAMKVGIEACLTVDGVVRVSAENYGGKLGDYKIYLRELSR